MSDIVRKIYEEFSKFPRDVQTRPIQINRKPCWFYVYTIENKIMIGRAVNHSETSDLKVDRVLDVVNADKMMDLYLRRKRKESVSKEAIRTTVNQVYWYGIFNELNY